MFNSSQGIKYLIDNKVLEDNCEDIAKFFHYTNQLCWHKVRVFLRERLVFGVAENVAEKKRTEQIYHLSNDIVVRSKTVKAKLSFFIWRCNFVT